MTGPELMLTTLCRVTIYAKQWRHSNGGVQRKRLREALAAMLLPPLPRGPLTCQSLKARKQTRPHQS